MASKNRVCVLGHLGKDVEARTFPSGDSVANFSVATTEKWKDRETGEQKESTQWHNCVANGKLAEIASKFLKKGSLVDIEGKLTYRKYTDKSGVERQVTEIRVSELTLLDKRPTQESAAPSRQPQAAAPRTNGRTAPAPQEDWATSDDGFPG